MKLEKKKKEKKIETEGKKVKGGEGLGGRRSLSKEKLEPLQGRGKGKE